MKGYFVEAGVSSYASTNLTSAFPLFNSSVKAKLRALDSFCLNAIRLLLLKSHQTNLT
jgi:hypothetical protein